jgi:PleD family two-component response regulator
MSQKKKILIVDDERLVARTLELKLAKDGHLTTAVFNGLEALEELAKREYDLVLLDIIMPEIDGWEVLAKFQERKHPGKIIIISNLCQPEDISKAKALGAHDYFVKTDVTLEEIAERVDRL